MWVEHSKSQPTDDKPSLKWAWSRHVTHFNFLVPLKYLWNGLRHVRVTWHRGRNHGWKVEGTKVWVPTSERLRPTGWVWEGSSPPAVGVRRYDPRKSFENLYANSWNPAFWWLLRSLVGSLGLGRVYPSKWQMAKFQNFNFSAVVASLVVRTKKAN